MKKTIFNAALKETITFNKTSEQTQGEYSELEIALEEGGGNPMHYHRSYSELFTAVKGELGLELTNGRQLILKPGEAFLVEKEVEHRFFNPGKGQIMFTNKVVPGSTGLENTLRILSGLANDGLYTSQNIPKNIYHMAVCGEMSDMRLTGIMGMITTPLIKMLARIAKRKGIEEELVKKYCV